MNDLTTFLLQPEWQRMGITLLHFLWQGVAILLAAWATVRILKVGHGMGRYGIYLAAFCLMSAAPLATYHMVDPVIQGTPRPDAPFAIGSVVPESGGVLAGAPAMEAVSEAAVPPTEVTGQKAEALGVRPENLWAATWLPRIVTFWGTGVVLLGVWFVVGLIGVWRLRRSGRRPEDERLAGFVRSLSEKMGLKNFRRVLVSVKVRQPLVLGFFRPAILLPARMLTGVPEDALRAALAHELAHVRRMDVLINGIQRVVEVVLFYHPAVWILSGLVRKEREICCDEAAVEATGDRLAYAEMLEKVYEAKLGASPAMAAALGGRGRSTLRRVRHVLGMGRRSSQQGWTFAGVLAAMAAFALVAGVGMAQAEEKKKAAQENEKAILGKWRDGRIAVEFLKDGDMRFYEGDRIEGGSYTISGDWLFLDLENEGEKSGMFLIEGDRMKVGEMEFVRVKPLDTKKLKGAWRGPEGQKIEIEDGGKIFLLEKQKELSGQWDKETNRVTLTEADGEVHDAGIVLEGDTLTVDGTVVLKRRAGTGEAGKMAGVWEAGWGPEGRGDIRVEVKDDGKVTVFSYEDRKSGKFEVDDDVLEVTFDDGGTDMVALSFESDDVLIVNGKEKMRRWKDASEKADGSESVTEEASGKALTTEDLAGTWAFSKGVITISPEGKLRVVEDDGDGSSEEKGIIAVVDDRLQIRDEDGSDQGMAEFRLRDDVFEFDGTTFFRIAGPNGEVSSPKDLVGIWTSNEVAMEFIDDGAAVIVSNGDVMKTTYSVAGNVVAFDHGPWFRFGIAGDELRLMGRSEKKGNRLRRVKPGGTSDASASYPHLAKLTLARAQRLAPAIDEGTQLASSTAVSDDGFVKALEAFQEARKAIALLEGPDVVQGGDPNAGKAIREAKFYLKRCREEIHLMFDNSDAAKRLRREREKKLDYFELALENEIARWEARVDASN